MQNNNPSNLQNFNPAYTASNAGVMYIYEQKILKSVKCCIPAIVVTYERTKGRASVRPALNLLATSGEQISRAVITDIPVHMAGGGGFIASFPLAAGDTGWLIVADRDISIFKQTGKESAINSFRTHNLQDAFFMPDSLITANNTPNFASEDSSNAVLQTSDGNTKISIGKTNIKIKASKIIIDGDVAVTGKMQATGEIISDTDVKAGAAKIGLTTHIHTNVTAGNAVTGAAQG